MHVDVLVTELQLVAVVERIMVLIRKCIIFGGLLVKIDAVRVVVNTDLNSFGVTFEAVDVCKQQARQRHARLKDLHFVLIILCNLLLFCRELESLGY